MFALSPSISGVIIVSIFRKKIGKNNIINKAYGSFCNFFSGIDPFNVFLTVFVASFCFSLIYVVISIVYTETVEVEPITFASIIGYENIRYDTDGSVTVNGYDYRYFNEPLIAVQHEEKQLLPLSIETAKYSHIYTESSIITVSENFSQREEKIKYLEDKQNPDNKWICDYRDDCYKIIKIIKIRGETN